MDEVVQKIILEIKNGFDLCDEKEKKYLHNKRVLVISSAREGVLEQVMEKYLLPAKAHISISGTERCKRYIDMMGLKDVGFIFHEGRYSVDSSEYKELRCREFDAVIYLVVQKDLYSYINIEELCQDYGKKYSANIYCADPFGHLWKCKDINKYVVNKKAYKYLIDHHISN